MAPMREQKAAMLARFHGRGPSYPNDAGVRRVHVARIGAQAVYVGADVVHGGLKPNHALGDSLVKST
jgi:hypothetical protein